MYLLDTNILLELLLDQEKADEVERFLTSSSTRTPLSLRIRPRLGRALPFFGANVMMPSCEQ